MSNPFTFPTRKSSKDIDIEDLFKDKKNRDPRIKDLLAPQADILREYQSSYSDRPDIGIELPTGRGKTLIGLLIGEWQIATKSRRVLYLCQTKQLAYQVQKHSKQYDIDVAVFVGPKRRFDKTELLAYRSAEKIAISTYSGLFNIKPEFENPQIIIMDDAHGAESYIGSNLHYSYEDKSEDKVLA